MVYLQIVFGFALLLGGAELLVRGAVAIARKLGISPMVIGMTVVAFGTSAPEAVVSIEAARIGASGIAIGNVVGSNVANVLLILGASAMIRPILSTPDGGRRDGLLLIVATLLFIGLCWPGVIGFIDAVLLLIAFSIFIGLSWWQETRKGDPAHSELAEEAEEYNVEFGSVWIAALVFLLGLGGVLWGADLLVDAAVELARRFGIGEEVIGLTVVAIGTSLPELAASGMAAWRGHSEVALGNIAGSNLFNLLFVIGVAGLFAPLSVSDQIIAFDIWVMLITTLMLLPFLSSGRNFGRVLGGLFLTIYITYLWSQVYGVERLIG